MILKEVGEKGYICQSIVYGKYKLEVMLDFLVFLRSLGYDYS